MTSVFERLRVEVEAALAPLAGLAMEELDGAGVAVALARMGDAIRAGVPLPDPPRTWLTQASPFRLGEALQEVRASLLSALVPDGMQDVESLEIAVGLRDRAESVRVAVLRAAIAAGYSPSTLPGWAEFEAARQAFDSLLAQTSGRLSVESALGDRVGLLDESGWTSAIPAEPAGDQEHLGLPLPGPVPGWAGPPPSVVAAWIDQGLHKGWVEACARRSAEVARDLLEHIAAARTMGNVGSLVALAWERQRTNRSHVRVELPERLAAAPVGSDTPLRVQLGRLGDVQASVRLTISGDEMELRVVEEGARLRSVRLGESGALPSEGVWSIRVARTAGPLRLRVEAEDGSLFEEDVEFVARADE